MSKENQKTVEVYRQTADLYLKNSKAHDELNPLKAKRKKFRLNHFIMRSFSSLPPNACIFEIGSGDGSTARYLKEEGYDVTGSDTSDAFIEATQSQGVKTIPFNVLEDDFPKKYHGIFCWRVFVHFTSDDMLYTLQKVYDALEEDGIFIFNAINREVRDVDEEWVDFPGEYHMGVDRYYHYFSQQEIYNLISLTKFKIKNFHKEGGDNDNKWLVYVLQK